MSPFEFAPREPVTLPIAESTRTYPVHRIFCVGRNYAAHAAEMGQSTREPPFFFTKFPCTVVRSGARLPYPPATRDFQYEGELVLALGASGFRVSPESAQSLIWGYAAGLDMTRRDLQLAAREKGRPWDTGKNFAQSAPMGAILPAARAGDLRRARLELSVNGSIRQQAGIADMIWSVPEIVAQLSLLYELHSGDLIFTGTPAGVGPLASGDRIDLSIGTLPRLSVSIGE